MIIRVLGRFEVELGGRPVTLGRRRERCLLAVLALNQGRVVPVTRLLELLWEDDQPARARRHLHAHVARLRSALAGEAPRIATAGTGYQLHADPGAIDAYQFRDLVARAATLPDPGRRAEILRVALALWRGQPLADIATDRLRERICGDLEELRLHALEQRVAADLDLGRHGEVIAELDALATLHPFREHLQALLMLALHRAGRDVEALQGFRAYRARLVEAHGVEPGVPLRRLHEALLRADGRLGTMPVARLADLTTPAPPPAVVPRELPAEVAGFTGRAAQLGVLDEACAAGRHGGPVVISAVAGAAGVGKTALAVHWAHRVAGRFPDGQLFVDLRGYSADPPVRPVEVLHRVLRSLGVAAERIPPDEAAAAGLYRSMLAGRRVLVLLDNARSADQVRPLLPGSPGCLVVVTSRDQLAGLVALQGARRVDLDVLAPAEAQALLIGAIGPAADADREAVARLARLCAHLPLALRIAAANITSRPHRGVAGYVAELVRDDRLDALALAGDEEAAVRRAFDVSYRSVEADQRRMFRLFGLVPGPDITAPAAAALAGTTPDAAARCLDAMVGVHLVEHRRPGRYTCHDLLRLYARERAESEEPPAERAAAVRRLSAWYLHAADAADRLLHPHGTRLPVPAPPVDLPPAELTDHAGALDWLDAERANLIAVCTAAGPDPVAWLLPDALHRYLHRRRLLTDLFTVTRAGLAAARAADEPRAAAAAHWSLAIAYATGIRRPGEAITHFTQALALSRRSGWRHGQTSALNGIALVHHVTGRLDRSIELQHEALELCRSLGHTGGQAMALNNLAGSHRDAGRLEAAVEQATASVALYRDTGSRGGAANAEHTLGGAYRLLGRFDRAATHFGRALAGFRSVGDREGEAAALIGFARTHTDAGRHDEAHDVATAAVRLGDRLGDHQILVESANALAGLLRALGRDREAIEHQNEALGVAVGMDYRYGVSEARIGLAAAALALGRHRSALKHAGAALDITGRAGFRVLEGQALTLLAAIRHELGDRDRAIADARRALALHRTTGHRLGEVHALTLIGQILHAAGPRRATQLVN